MMQKAYLIFLFLAFSGIGKAAENVVRVGLFGDSTLATSYLPKESRPDRALRDELKKRYPDQRCEVYNFALNGEFIARYLLSGKYDQARTRLGERSLDAIVVRFGINDQKYVDEAEFARQLNVFVDLLKTDFPGAAIILETGPFVDFPAHYHYDREAVLSPYWEKTRQIAEQQGLQVSDYHRASKAATAAGNWDLRIRLTDSKNEGFVIDASRDSEHTGDPKWFSDIHPNSPGIQLAAVTQAQILKDIFPDQIPSGKPGADFQARTTEDYARMLDFSPDRLARPRKVAPVDRLQTPDNAP